MATSSFDEMMVIDTPEAAANLNAAYWEAVKRGPLNLDHIDFEEELRKGREFLRKNPNWLKECVAKAREDAEKVSSGVIDKDSAE